MPGHPCRVFIDLGAVVIAVNTEHGKAYLNGVEEQTTTSPTTVDVAYTPITVFGVYADAARTGPNLLQQVAADGSTNVANPDRFSSATIAYVAGDAGSTLQVSGSVNDGVNGGWLIETVVGPADATLRGRLRADGDVDAPGTGFDIDVPDLAGPFRQEHTGLQIEITAPPAAVGTYAIASVTDSKTVVLGAAVPGGPHSDVSWRFEPDFATEGPGLGWAITRGSTAGVTVTFPTAVAHPSTVFVDYTHVNSAQVLLDETIANAPAGTYFPFYLSDGLAWVREIADLLTVAGVIPIFGEP